MKGFDGVLFLECPTTGTDTNNLESLRCKCVLHAVICQLGQFYLDPTEVT